MTSETSKLRDLLLPHCTGNGLDLGFGGDKIQESAIGVERDKALMHTGSQSAQLIGSADNLYWFKDSVLDYLYSSHLLEDFEDTKKILLEWCRVVKTGGNVVLNLPHDKTFLDHCIKSGQAYNHEHKCKQMSIEWMRQVVEEINNEKGYEYLKITFYTGIQHIYCFGMVIKVN